MVFKRQHRRSWIQSWSTWNAFSSYEPFTFRCCAVFCKYVKKGRNTSVYSCHSSLNMLLSNFAIAYMKCRGSYWAFGVLSLPTSSYLWGMPFTSRFSKPRHTLTSIARPIFYHGLHVVDRLLWREGVQYWVDGRVDWKNEHCYPGIHGRVIEFADEGEHAKNHNRHPTAEIGHDHEENLLAHGRLRVRCWTNLLTRFANLHEYGDVANKNEKKSYAIETDENSNRILPSRRAIVGQLQR